MPKGNMIDEISILRFFETGPIEKAEVVFNIVREKMRERLSGRMTDGEGVPPGGQGKRRNSRATADVEREVPKP